MPNRDTPPRLVEAWLDFHREELCRSLDAVFAFDGQGMEIWCRSEENRAYRKLQKIIEPLRKLHGVELYLTRPPKNNGEDDVFSGPGIPPSLAENRELRSYLRPSLGQNTPRVIIITDSEGETYTRVLSNPPTAADVLIADRVLRSRLIVWAKRLLENNRIMRQCAADIPELLKTAVEPAFGVALRGRAKDICVKHAKDLIKSVQDLRKDLSRAFPKPSAKNSGNENKKAAGKKETPATSLPVVMEKADEIAAGARVLSGRVYRFIYPVQHTVDMDELQKPGLLVSLDALDAETGDFRRDLTHLHLS